MLFSVLVSNQLPGFASDVDKLLDKAKSQGGKILLKEAGSMAKGKFNLNSLTKNGTTPATGATPATTAAPAATAGATPAATPAATPVKAATPGATGGAAPAASSAPGAAVNPAAQSTSSVLKEKATKETGRFVNKYGAKYLQQGEKQVDKLLGK